MTKWALTVCGDTNSNLAISRLVLPPPDSGAAGHLHRNLDGQDCTGEQHLGALAVQRAAYRCGNTGWYRVADQVMPESRPLPDSDACPLRQASQIVTSDSGTDNQLAAASSVTENRREALYRRRPIRPDRAIHTSRAPAALPRCKPQAVHRRVWPSRTRPRRHPFLSAMEALDEQERVAVSLLDRALPGWTPLSHPNR
jgi:hypothetical protein